jgi:hypothetical protein
MLIRESERESKLNFFSNEILTEPFSSVLVAALAVFDAWWL